MVWIVTSYRLFDGSLLLEQLFLKSLILILLLESQAYDDPTDRFFLLSYWYTVVVISQLLTVVQICGVYS